MATWWKLTGARIPCRHELVIRCVDASDALDERSVDPDPYLQFASWFADAQIATEDKAAAMTIATATPDGRPSARVVLLRGFDERGLVFYTNYDSRKAEELEANPFGGRPLLLAAARPPDPRRGTGDAGRARASRRRTSRGGPAAIRSVPGRRRRARRSRTARSSSRCFDDAEARFADPSVDVPLPPFWGGYRLEPEVFEFWVNRADRLHDRIRYRRADDGWVIERLAP